MTNSHVAIQWWNFATNEAYLLHRHPTPSKHMPRLLQEMVDRWCQLSVSLVLTIDVYAHS